MLALCSPLSDVTLAAPLYEVTSQPLDGCEELFSSTLCRSFDFLLQSETAARFEQDTIIVRPASTYRGRGGRLPSAYYSRGLIIDACTVAALIRETEALLNSRFIELRFERITIRGALHLSELDPRARLSFLDVNFVPGGRGERTLLHAGFVQPAFSIDGELNIAPAVPEPPECLRSELLGPAFAGSSVVIERSHFRDRVLFERALFEGSVIVSGSAFDSNFDIVESDVGGDLVIESSKFASDLELGRDTILRGQIVVDGVRVRGAMAIDGIDVIDTYLDPQELATLTADPDPSEALALAHACICAHRNGSFNIDTGRLDIEPPNREGVAQACKRLPNLPRCPRSNGFKPVLIEIRHTDVAGLFSLTDLALGSRDADFRPFKSSIQRFETLDECPFSVVPGGHPPPKCESSLSRLESADILIDDLSVAGAALLQGNQGTALYLYQSSIERLASEGNEFHWFVIARNEFGAFSSVTDTLYRGLRVTRNKVAGSLELDSLVLSHEFLQKQEEESKLYVGVTHNLVGRDLAFTPHGLKGGMIDEVDLSTNRVGGELAVSLPVAAKRGAHTPKHLDWSGLIALKGLDVDGTLAIQFAERQVKSGTMIVDFLGTLAKNGVSCGARDGAHAPVHLDLANSVAKNVLWAAPLRRPKESAADCVSWEGVGLRYDNWEASAGWGDLDQENGTAGRGGGSTPLPDLLDLWRELYVRTGPEARAGEPPPDPLHHMADYLAKIGEQKASREVRADAKGAGFSLPAGDFLATLGNVIAWIIFFPTDFGTNPQFALALLFGITLFAWMIYRECRWHHVWRWPHFRDLRDTLMRRDGIKQAMLQYLAVQDLAGQISPKGTSRREDIVNRYAPMNREDSPGTQRLQRYPTWLGDLLSRPWQRSQEDMLAEELRHISAVPGFMQYDRDRQPQDFALWRYALDTMIPVIDLHTYNQYYPHPKWLRTFATLQHVAGWWVLTSFIASLAVF